ncbi:DUF397 domain-containing protein [Streptomyces sp. NPDC002962]|uniref:DUF397 domain-containing protein n=1 Tax=Streptomyces sp. NPDC002962 TaxID=3364674 RepID=UPI00367D07A1
MVFFELIYSIFCCFSAFLAQRTTCLDLCLARPEVFAHTSRAVYGEPGGVVVRPGDHWKKSSYSESGACVEVAFRDALLIRDSKHPPQPGIRFTAAAWCSFVGAVQAGFSSPSSDV